MSPDKSERRTSKRLEVRRAIGEASGRGPHELNNLLTIILGNLELLEERLVAGSREGLLLRAALDAARRGAELNRSLLTGPRHQSAQGS